MEHSRGFEGVHFDEGEIYIHVEEMSSTRAKSLKNRIENTALKMSDKDLSRFYSVLSAIDYKL